MQLPLHKTKIVCTIGPASSSVPVLEELLRAGMNVARINFSHGDRASIREKLENIRAAARATGSLITIIADLPGEKIRLGLLSQEPLVLAKGQHITLTGDGRPAAARVIPVQYRQLAQSVSPGQKIFINDGFVELRVDEVKGEEIRCSVVMGGPLYSRKGVNLPGAKLFVDPVTPRDLELLAFALEEGIDTFALSFVEKAADIHKVRDHARSLGKPVQLIAKIERSGAVDAIDEILTAADGIMVARGDLGVETPIEEVPVVQKRLIARATLLGKPVITATQMLESMKNNTRPTRAEVSDVANAILDGTDAVMLSEETAIGDFPVETVRMMASVAAYTEEQRFRVTAAEDEMRWYLRALSHRGQLTVPDVISRNAVVDARLLEAAYIVTPTDTGNTARRVARYKPECWVLAFSRFEETCRFLAFSYGVYPFLLSSCCGSGHEPLLDLVRQQKLGHAGDKVVITGSRVKDQPGGTDALEIFSL